MSQPRKLTRLCLAGSLFLMISTLSARDAMVDPDDRDYLRRQYAWFQSLPAGRQQQLRQLNEEFHKEDAETQARLIRVMQHYNAWLMKLSEADRNQVIHASSAAVRLQVIADLRERDWVQTLPKVMREEYAKLSPEAKAVRVKEWRTEESNRQDDWLIAQKNWDDVKVGRVPAGFAAEPRVQLEAFVSNLRNSLSEADRKSLDDARIAADEHGQFVWYAIEIVRLADTHPLLPGRVGGKDFNSLPEPDREYLIKNDRTLRKKGLVFQEDNKELKRSAGRWPDYSLEMVKHCEKNNLKLPVPLGDCTKAQMPPEVQTFLDKTLEPLLKKTDRGKEQLETLNRVQGRWPEYPRMIMELAKAYKLPIPGWTLPGLPQSWDRFRVNRMNKKPA